MEFVGLKLRKEETQSSGLGWFLEFGVGGGQWIVSRIDLRFQGSEKGETGVRIPGSGRVGTRTSLKHQVQGNGWRVRTRSEEWVRQAEAEFHKTRVGTDKAEDGRYFGIS